MFRHPKPWAVCLLVGMLAAPREGAPAAHPVAASAQVDATQVPTRLPWQERLLPEIIVVAARRAQPRRDAVGTVTVLGRPALDRQQVHELADLVRYEPGVAVTRNPTRFGAEGFNIRGLEGNRIAIEVDGVALPQAFSVGRLSRAGRDAIEPELIERVEILRGPASTLYGSDALGGIVAITTRRPADLVNGDKPHAALRLSHTSRDQGERLSALAALQVKHLGLLGLYARRLGRETENNAGSAGPPANPARSRRRSGVLRGVLARGNLDVDFSREHFSEDVSSDIRTAQLAPGQFANTLSLLSHDRDVRDRSLLRVRLNDAGRLAGNLEIALYDQQSRTRQDLQEIRRAAPPAVRAPVSRARRFVFDTRQSGVELLAHRSDTLGPLRQRLAIGAEWRETEVEELRDGSETNLLTRAVTTFVLGERLPVRDFPNAVVTERALFGSSELDWRGTPWTLVLGFRVDEYAVDARADAVFLADNPGLSVRDLNDRALTPRLALRHELGREDTVTLAYTEGYRAAPFADVNIALVIPQFNYVVRPNHDLAAERSRGLEAAWHHESMRLQWRLSAFYNDYRDLIESRANLGPDADGATIFQSINRDRARIFGVEASAVAVLSSLAPALTGVRLRAGLAWAEGDDRRRQQPLNTVQPARMALGLERDARGVVPELALIATASAAKTRVDRSTADLFVPPGFVTLDLRARHRFGRHLTLDVGLYNLGDKRYWEWSALRGVTASNVPAPAFFTAPGRHFALTLELGW